MKPPHRFGLLAAALLAATGILHADDDDRGRDRDHSAPSVRLKPVGSYASGLFNVGGAEIVAHDPKAQRLFVVNAQTAELDVLSIAQPSRPRKVGAIALKPYGAVANSVSVHDGLIAVAVEAVVKTDPGVVVFFDRRLKFVNKVTVGALPDMVTFTPNGRYVLVANEGEPNAAYSVDPEGSVSVIDLKRGAAWLRQSDVRTAGFTAFNGGTLDPSIRVYGPGASVAQDIEPEYIAVSADSKTAWVTCQENNAMAVIDIAKAEVTKLVGLGHKDHQAIDAALHTYTFDPASMPSIGTTLAGQELFLGGFSGLHFEGVNPHNGNLKFITHTDRGPNAEPVGLLRPFLLPEFAPQIVRFELNRRNGRLKLTQRIPLQRAPGQPLTGLSNTQLAGGTASSPYMDETPVDLLGNVLPLDPLGADLEGLVKDPNDGSFWMVDEYRPAIYHFNPAGVLLQRYVPMGTAAAAGMPEGTYGTEALPAVLAQRRQNRGFEAIAWDNGKIYAFVQSPLRNPVSVGNAALGAQRNVRVVEFNPVTLATKQFLYVLDNANLGAEPNTRADKIGDAVSFGNGEFLVVERDDDAVPGDASATIEKKIYRFNLNGATDISTNGVVGDTGKTVDQLTLPEMLANGIRPIEKILHVDLNAVGYNQVQKVEGLTLIDPWTLAVINDNDFGTASITIHPDGTFTRNYVPDPIQLGIIDVRLNGLDASERDGKVNIRQWPVKGLFLPDAIASFQAGRQTFLITANEGDAREYVDEAAGTSFIEAVRIGATNVFLDPVRFPNAATLKHNNNQGRLNITSTLGRNPTNGVYEDLFAFGTRSFSIWTTEGKLVFDSGDDLEWITALAYPTNFNASHSANDFDNRSDDKGPEPEGVVIGRAYGRTLAFIGLERIGGVVTYDVTNPYAPEFVDYVNFRDFTAAVETPQARDLGPEGLLFIPEHESPNGRPLLVVGNEISGTTTIFEVRCDWRRD